MKPLRVEADFNSHLDLMVHQVIKLTGRTRQILNDLFFSFFSFKEIIVRCGNSETFRDPQDSTAVLTEFEKYRNKAEEDIARLVEETSGLKEKVEMLEGQLSFEKARRETAEMLAADRDVEVNRQRRVLDVERNRRHEQQLTANEYKEIIDKSLPGM